LAVAGVGVAVWGGLAVTSVSATATAPDCSTSPPSGACLNDGAGFELVTAADFVSNGGVNGCGAFETQGTSTDGFHFVLPASQGTAFSSLTAYLDEGGVLVTVTGVSVTFTNGGMQAVINVPNGATLLEASATITGGSFGTSGTDAHNDSPFFVLSSTCPGTGSSSSSTTTITGTGGTSAVTTTSGGGRGAGALGVTIGLPKAGAQSGSQSRANLEGPLAIGMGLAVAGLAMLGLSYRRRERTE